MPDYLRFTLTIDAQPGGSFTAQARSDEAGEVPPTPVRLPATGPAIKPLLNRLNRALQQSYGGSDYQKEAAERVFQQFGQNLFDSVFIGQILVVYEKAVEIAQEAQVPLRVQFVFNQPDLAGLPWEYLYNPSLGAYLCRSTTTPVVRYLEVPRAIRSLTGKPPARILIMAPRPANLDPLAVESEVRHVEDALKDLLEAGRVQVKFMDGGTYRDLQNALRDGPWHIFHFIGHGGFNESGQKGYLALSTPSGRTQKLDADSLADLLAGQPEMRLVVLNACKGGKTGFTDLFSGVAGALVRRGMTGVVAMQQAVSDDAAVEFSRSFYEALASNAPIESAVTTARQSIEASGSLEWGIPVLFMRATSGRLFPVEGERAQSSAPVSSAAGSSSMPVEAPPAATAQPAEDPEALAREGESLLRSGDPDAALTVLERAINLRPQDGRILALRGEAFRLKSEFPRALADFDAALVLDSRNDYALSSRGETYRQTGNFTAALSDLGRAIDLNRLNPFAFASRGETLRQLDRFSEAIEDLNQAIALDPNYAWALASRGEAYRQTDQFERALDDFNRALAVDAQYPWALSRRGETLKRIGRIDEAIVDLSQAIDLNRWNTFAFASRADCYQLLGRVDEALADLNRALQLDPDYSYAYATRAYVQRIKGNFREAFEDIRRALQTEPESARNYDILGEIYLLSGQAQPALDNFRHAVQLEAGEDWYVYQRGLANTQLGSLEAAGQDFEQAISFARKAVREQPDWSDQFNLALYLLAAGDTLLSTAYYRDILQRNPPAMYRLAARRDVEEFARLRPGRREPASILALFAETP